MVFRTMAKETNNIRATITIGLQVGYGDDNILFTTAQALDLLDTIHKEAKFHIPFVVKEVTVSYVIKTKNGTGNPKREPSLELTADKVPYHAAGLSENEWKRHLKWYAHTLAMNLEQQRVYVTFSNVDTIIYARS
jgi:hypothetical protein